MCHKVFLCRKVAELDNKKSSVLVRKDENDSPRYFQFNAQLRKAFQQAQVISLTSFHFVLLN
jgi:hypothetical protein